jgi:hypothetical protein
MFKNPIQLFEKFSPGVFATSLLLVLLSASLTIHAQTWRWVDEHGVTHFSTEAPHEEQAEKVKPGRKDIRPDSSRAQHIEETERYQQQRQQLQQQIERTSNPQTRGQLVREQQLLDLQWYQKYDPEKAAALQKEMDEPKIRVIEKKPEPSKLDKYKAFY